MRRREYERAGTLEAQNVIVQQLDARIAGARSHEARAAESREYEEAGRLLREVKDLETQLAEACQAAQVLLNAVEANE